MGSGGESLRPAPIQVHSAKTRTWSSSQRVSTVEFDRWRILISTSALEVGFDHSEIIATWQYHAPPSVASFVQRKGRGGRGPRDYPITMMVLGPGPSDSHAFHEHLRYVDVDGFDCYLDETNPSVRKQHVFAAVLDFCAAQGRNLYKRPADLPQVVAANRDKVTSWVVSALGLKEGETISEIDRICEHIRKEWLADLDLSSNTYLGRKVRPVDLFSTDCKAGLEEWRRNLPPSKAITCAWVDAALNWIRKSGSERRAVSILDLCVAVPASRRTDPDRRIPESTIPVPLGGNVDVVRRDGTRFQPEAGESAEFALRSFLPGGFKIRYGRLLMSPWVHARREAGRNVTWAATRQQIRAISRDSLPKRFSELVASGVSPAARAELTAAIGGDAVMAFPESVIVDDLGAPRNRRFYLDERTLAVSVRKPQQADAVSTALTRDPNVTPLCVTVPKPARGVWVCAGEGVFAEANYHAEFKAVRCQYGNLVHCYPEASQVRSLVVRFHDETANSPLVLATELRSQAVEFVLAKHVVKPLSRSQAYRAYWSRVAALLGGRSALERGVLPSSFVVADLVACAREAELIEFGKAGVLAEEGLDPARWSSALERLARDGRRRNALEVLRKPSVQVEVVKTLEESRTWLVGVGGLQVAADSLLAAARHMAARAINVAPDALVQLSVVTPERTRLFLLDNHDGGSGSARRVADVLGAWGGAGISKRLREEAQCPAATVDQVVGRAMSAGLQPDLLSAMARDRTFPMEWFAGVAEHVAARSTRRLARLVESPALAAFSLFAHECRVRLEDAMQGPVPVSFLAREVSRTQAMDVRAEWLRRKFLEQRDGLSELEVRVGAVSALCEAGCPECIGSGQWSETSFADRTYLAGLVGVAI